MIICSNVSNDVDYVMDNFGDKITVVGALDNQFMETPGKGFSTLV